MSAAAKVGKLYVVGTPIGNLGDLTLRAIETLKHVAWVAAEDTRRTRALLSHLGIAHKPVLSVHEHSKSEVIASVVARLEAGEDGALVTDAGMPGISDPGTELVRAAAKAGVDTLTVPGPSAVSAALSISGFAGGPFTFIGFLPRKGPARRRELERIEEATETVVLFEAPARVRSTLKDLAECLPTRGAVLCRELTKLHEQTLRGSLEQLALAEFPSRGEFTLVIAGKTGDGPKAQIADTDPTSRREALEASARQRLRDGASVRAVVEELLSESGLRKRELYALVQHAHDQLE